MDINKQLDIELSKLSEQEQWDILSKVSTDMLCEELDKESNFSWEENDYH